VIGDKGYQSLSSMTFCYAALLIEIISCIEDSDDPGTASFDYTSNEYIIIGDIRAEYRERPSEK
jgi:hypothetical protein